MVSLHTVWNGSEADITFTVMEDELFMWEEKKKENSSEVDIIHNPWNLPHLLGRHKIQHHHLPLCMSFFFQPHFFVLFLIGHLCPGCGTKMYRNMN